ncbi:hypothetical protein EU537_13170 [Candidatus Thorarchaeota archaeon]|nr:MAG: hypothetical protein EU537_13170 [Candidatus Thorarchaeota archaeon]
MTHIKMKENAPEILEKELSRLGCHSTTQLKNESLLNYLDSEEANRIEERLPPCPVIGISGGVSDAYQPIESKLKITRRILKVLLDFKTPVFILTKSDLVLRDLDLLREINELSFANVVFTITLANESERSIFEPRASPNPSRFDALRELRENRIHGGIMATPIIPYIGDTCENMTALAKAAKESKAEFIQFGGLTLKPGRQKELFMHVVRQNFPHKAQMISSLYSNADYYGAPIYEKLPVNVLVQGYKICKQIGISDRSLRHVRPGQPEMNTIVVSKLLDISIRMRSLGYQYHKIKPYRDAAQRVEAHHGNIKSLLENEDADLMSVTPEIRAAIHSITKTGSCQILDDMKSKLDSLEDGCY